MRSHPLHIVADALGVDPDLVGCDCSVCGRADERGASLIEAVGTETRVRPEEAVAMTGTPYGPLDPDAPIPWDFIQAPYPKQTVRKAYDVMIQRLTERGC